MGGAVLRTRTIAVGAMDAVIAAVLLALSVAAAVLSYLLVERPFLHHEAPAPKERDATPVGLPAREQSSVA